VYDEAVRNEARRLLREGRSVNQTSKLLGVSRAAISAWRDLPPGSGPTCPAPSKSTAEYAELFGFYLGDGHIVRNGGAYALRISCDATIIKVIREVDRSISALRPNHAVLHLRRPGVVIVQSYWKHWPCLFPQHGPDRKHERELGMADWQWAIVEDHPAAFLRGLFHSDGCRVHNWATRMVAGGPKRYDYPRWQFVNASEEILSWCGDALDLVDVPWRRSGRRTISVSRREAVAALDTLIGPKH